MSGPAQLALERLGLRRAPFPHTPDAAAYFASAHLERELSEALHCLRARSGFVLLTGEVGTGKSTFVRRLLDQAGREGLVSSLVLNTFLQGAELLAAILRDFGLAPRGSMAADVETLNRFLLELWRNGHGCVLVIDDAQNLDLESLELLRLLSSIETAQEKLLQIVLAGQPELRARLDDPRIRQLTSRIVKHVQLAPLEAVEIGAYVRFRLQTAGAGPELVFGDDAATALLAVSRGNPRRIHLIMERCLYGLLALETWRIDAALVRAAAAEAGVQPVRATRALLRSPPRPPLALTAAFSLVLLSGLLGLASRHDEQGRELAAAMAASSCTPWLALMPDSVPVPPGCGPARAHGWTMLAPGARATSNASLAGQGWIVPHTPRTGLALAAAPAPTLPLSPPIGYAP